MPMDDYTIAFDAERRFLDITIFGVWNIITARRYRAAIVDLAPKSGPFDMIVDIQTRMVLPADAASEIEASLSDLARRGLRHAAHVTTSALSAMQVRRIGGSHAVMAFFSTRAEALDWLASVDHTPTKLDVRR